MASSVQLARFHDRSDGTQLQEGEDISQPAYVKGKVARPMIQRRAGSGVYYRVNILAERDNQIQVYYPPYENDPDFREWVYRTSSRIHRATNGKWSYVGRGGWRYNTKGSKKRSRARVADAKMEATCDPARRCDAKEARSIEPSASDCSQATTSTGCKLGGVSNNAVAAWFESHMRARQTAASQAGDKVVACGPAMRPPAVRSQLRSSADVQSNPSNWSGEDATSARQADELEQHQPLTSKPRHAPDLCASAAEGLEPGQVERSAQRPCDSQCAGWAADPSESAGKSGPYAAATCKSGLSKVVQLAEDGTPGRQESRRSSSTLEGGGTDCKVASRMCET